MEMKRLSMWKGSPEINSRGGLAWLLTFCEASTKSVITFYWEVQWTCGFLHWKLDFKTIPWSTHVARELSGFKSYDQIIMKVQTCPNWSTWFFFIDSSHCIPAPPLSHIYLSTTNVEHLGSITFSDMLKLISARIEFTFCWSFLVWRCVIGPWSIVACVSDAWCYVTRGMSTSSSSYWKGVIVDSVMYVWLGMCTSSSSSWKGVVLDYIVQVRLGMCTSSSSSW
jgi:hypothetical protein